MQVDIEMQRELWESTNTHEGMLELIPSMPAIIQFTTFARINTQKIIQSTNKKLDNAHMNRKMLTMKMPSQSSLMRNSSVFCSRVILKSLP